MSEAGLVSPATWRKPSADSFHWLDGGECGWIQKAFLICCCTISVENLGLTGLWGCEACFVHALWVRSCPCCKPEWQMYSKIRDRFMRHHETYSMIWIDILKNARPAGATSQDKHLPSVPTNLLRLKSPDKDIMINKTAGEKSCLEIKSCLFIWAVTVNCHLTTHLSQMCGPLCFQRLMSHVGLIIETTVWESRNTTAYGPGGSFVWSTQEKSSSESDLDAHNEKCNNFYLAILYLKLHHRGCQSRKKKRRKMRS